MESAHVFVNYPPSNEPDVVPGIEHTKRNSIQFHLWLA